MAPSPQRRKSSSPAKPGRKDGPPAAPPAEPAKPIPPREAKPTKSIAQSEVNPAEPLAQREAKIEQARRELHEARDKLRQEYEQFRAKRHAAQEVLNQRVQENEARLNRKQRMLRQRRQRLARFRKAIGEQLAQLHKLGKKSPQAGELRAAVTQLQAELDAANAELQTESDAHEALATDQDQLKGELSRLGRDARVAEALEARLEQQTQQVEEHLAALEARGEELAQLTREAEQLRTERDALHRQIEQLQHTRQDEQRALQEQLAHAEARRKKLVQQARRLRTADREHESQLAQLTAQQADHQQTIARLQRELAATSDQLDVEQRQFAERSEQLTAQIADWQNRLQLTERQVIEIQQLRDREAEQHTAAQRSSQTALRERETECVELREALEAGRAALDETNARHREGMAAVEARLADAAGQITQLTRDGDEARQRLEALDAECEQLRTRQAQQQNAHAVLTGERDALQAEIARLVSSHADTLRVVQQERDAARADAESTQADLIQDRRRLEELTARTADLQAGHEQALRELSDRLATQGRELQQVRDALAEQQKVAIDLTCAEQQARTECQQLRDQLAALEQQHAKTLAELNSSLEAKDKELARVLVKEKEETDELDKLHRELEKQRWEHRDALAAVEAKLEQTTRQMNQHMQALRTREQQLLESRAKEAELQTCVRTAESAKTDAETALAANRKELEQHRREVDALHRKLREQRARADAALPTDLSTEGELPATMLADDLWEEAGDDTADTITPPGSPDVAAVLPSGGLRVRTAVGVVCACLCLSLAGLVLALWVVFPTQYLVQGVIGGTPMDRDRLEQAQQIARTPELAPPDASWRVRAGPDEHTVTLALVARDPEAGRRRINDIAAVLLKQLNANLPASQPADHTAARLERLRADLAVMENQIAAAAQPASIDTPAASLISELRDRCEEHRNVAESIRRLTTQLTAGPAPTTTEAIDPSPLADADAAMRQLQADADALKERQGRLAGMLQELLAAGPLRFANLRDAIARADAYLAAELAAGHDPDVRAQLDHLRQSQNVILEAGRALEAAWIQAQADMVADPENENALGVQKNLDTSARRFVEAVQPARQQVDAALEAIKQGGDEPTKRLVLHRTVSQRLAEMTDAADKALYAGQLLIADQNAHLAAVLSTVQSLTERVQLQRERIESRLRAQMLTDLRRQHQEEVDKATQERDQLIAQAQALEVRIAALAEQAAQAAAHERDQSRQQSELMSSLDRRVDLLKQMADLQSVRQEGPAIPSPLWYLPARAVPLPRLPLPEPTATAALAALPLAGGLMLCLILLGWLGRRHRATHATITPTADLR